jgi:hypothetical protein
MKAKAARGRPHLFVALGVAMLLAGFALMLTAVTGGRLGSNEAFPLPVGFTTAAVGGMLLTRTPLAVFFLAVFAIAGLILAPRETGWLHPVPALFAVLLACCLPLAKRAKA